MRNISKIVPAAYRDNKARHVVVCFSNGSTVCSCGMFSARGPIPSLRTGGRPRKADAVTKPKRATKKTAAKRTSSKRTKVSA